jgi:hypothetical protein
VVFGIRSGFYFIYMHKKYIIDGKLKCSKCKQSFPADRSHFNGDKRNPTGFYSQCKECQGYKFGIFKKEIPKASQEGYKVCSKCLMELPNDRKHFFMTGRHILDTVCKECRGFKFVSWAPKAFLNNGNKECPQCKKILPATLEYFQKSSQNKSGLQSYCKKCRHENATKVKDKSAIKRHNYYIENKQILKQKQQQYCFENKEKINKQHRAKWKNNPQFAIANLLRGRINKAFAGKIKKCDSTEKLLGCSWGEFTKYLETKFTDGMTWGNRGKGMGKWHVDHIIPPPCFDLTDPEQQRICFHWANLQPMWEPQNCSKGSVYNGKRYFYNRPPITV